MFTETEITQIWRLFSLDRDQLIVGSSLRTAITDLQTFDSDNGTSLVLEVRDLLAQVTQEESLIEAEYEDIAVASYNAAGDASVTYRSNIDPVSLRYRTKQNLLNEIWKILELDRYLADARPRGAKVRGVASSIGYNYSLTPYPSRVR